MRELICAKFSHKLNWLAHIELLKIAPLSIQIFFTALGISLNEKRPTLQQASDVFTFTDCRDKAWPCLYYWITNFCVAVTPFTDRRTMYAPAGKAADTSS
jgi:hypothetical protein